jgi:regulator of nucleoside diphosphate kinase
MKGRTILITTSDMNRLERLFQRHGPNSGHDPRHLEHLKSELKLADLVEDTEVPPDVITIYSRVLVQDLETGRNSIYVLVFPNEADLSLNKVSVLAPLGTALLGQRTGDVIDWKMPGGKNGLFVVRRVLYQPEAAGERVLRAA